MRSYRHFVENGGLFNDTAKRLTTSFCLLGRYVRGFNGLPHAPEGSCVPLAVVFPSLTLKQLKHCANRVYRLPSGEFRFFVRDTHGNKHGLQSNHINAYRTDFLDSVKTALTKLCCCAFSCRCGEPPTFSALTLPRAPPHQRERHVPRFDLPSLSP